MYGPSFLHERKAPAVKSFATVLPLNAVLADFTIYSHKSVRVVSIAHLGRPNANSIGIFTGCLFIAKN